MFGHPAITRVLLTETLDAKTLRRRDAMLAVLGRLGRCGVQAGAAAVIAEIFSNALQHGQTRELGIAARQRRNLLLLVFRHTPPLSESALAAYGRAKGGWLPDAADLGFGGLGLPLIARLSRRVTISADRTRVRIWLVVHSSEVQPC